MTAIRLTSSQKLTVCFRAQNSAGQSFSTLQAPNLNGSLLAKPDGPLSARRCVQEDLLSSLI